MRADYKELFKASGETTSENSTGFTSTAAPQLNDTPDTLVLPFGTYFKTYHELVQRWVSGAFCYYSEMYKKTRWDPSSEGGNATWWAPMAHGWDSKDDCRITCTPKGDDFTGYGTGDAVGKYSGRRTSIALGACFTFGCYKGTVSQNSQHGYEVQLGAGPLDSSCTYRAYFEGDNPDGTSGLIDGSAIYWDPGVDGPEKSSDGTRPKGCSVG